MLVMDPAKFLSGGACGRTPPNNTPIEIHVKKA